MREVALAFAVVAVVAGIGLGAYSVRLIRQTRPKRKASK